MRKIIGIFGVLVLTLFCGDAIGQQLWNPRLKVLNMFDQNAAAAGQYNSHTVTLRYRQQWTGFEGAPISQYGSFNGPVTDAIRFGVRFNRQSIGAFNHTRVTGHIAYAIFLNESELSFSFGGGVESEQFFIDKVNLYNQGDESFENLLESEILPVAVASILYRRKHSFLGAEIRNLLQSGYSWSNSDINHQAFHGQIHAGFEISITDNLDLFPVVSAAWSSNLTPLPEIQASVWYKKKFWLGAGHTWENGFHAFSEIDILKRYRLGYAFEWQVNDLQSVQSGSHEVFFSWIFRDSRFKTSRKSYLP